MTSLSAKLGSQDGAGARRTAASAPAGALETTLLNAFGCRGSVDSREGSPTFRSPYRSAPPASPMLPATVELGPGMSGVEKIKGAPKKAPVSYGLVPWAAVSVRDSEL